MGHYFENNTPKNSKRYSVNYIVLNKSFSLLTSDGVFSKKALDEGSELLIKVLLQETLVGSFLDLGCGYGPVGITIASFVPSLKMTLVDVNQAAVMDAKLNAETLGLHHLQIVNGNGFNELTAKFDVIAFNPPIRVGKKAIYTLYQDAVAFLNPTGSLYIVIRKDKGALSHYAYLKTLFKQVTLHTRAQGYHVYVAKP